MRPIPSRATSGYYKALEPFGPRSGTFQHLFGQATTVHRVDPLRIDLLDPVHDPAHGLFRCEDARLTVQVAHLFAQIFSYDGRLVAAVAQVDTAKYCQKPCAVSSISISTTSSSRPVRSYAWRCRSAPLPRSKVSRTSAETSSQSSASSKAGRVKASSFSIISRAGTACSDSTSKSFASSPSREASQWAARGNSGRVFGYVSSRSARSWHPRAGPRVGVLFPAPRPCGAPPPQRAREARRHHGLVHPTAHVHHPDLDRLDILRQPCVPVDLGRVRHHSAGHQGLHQGVVLGARLEMPRRPRRRQTAPDLCAVAGVAGVISESEG